MLHRMPRVPQRRRTAGWRARLSTGPVKAVDVQAEAKDRGISPRRLDRMKKRATIDRVCGIPHYSRTVRPPTSYTNPIKRAWMRELGVDDPALFELDHRVPLCAGGHPTDPQNLWLESDFGSRGPTTRKNRLRWIAQAIVSVV